jgi:hypothetical protein
MVIIIEFRSWLAKCCLDGSTKLGLQNIEIAFALLQEAQKWLLESLTEAEGENCSKEGGERWK